MLQFKERKPQYRNADKKLKAALRGRGFQGNSITYLKIMNLNKMIIRHDRKNRTAFLPAAKNKLFNQGGE